MAETADQIQQKEDSSCPICFESFRKHKIIAVETPCSHKFCKRCILQLLLGSDVLSCPICRSKLSLSDRFLILKSNSAHEEEYLIPPIQDINNLVYLQTPPFLEGVEGVASYHFDLKEKKCYISYENAPDNWELDNGMLLRDVHKAYFTEWKYDTNQRLFSGTIDWYNTHDTTVHDGSTKWVYRMFFSEDFQRIQKGECTEYKKRRKVMTHEFNQDLFYTLDKERHLFQGLLSEIQSIDSLVYVQFQGLGYASYHFYLNSSESHSDAEQQQQQQPYISYQNAPETWKLDNGMAISGKNKVFSNWKYDYENRKFEGEICWTELGTTWDSEAKWVYKMIFSKDFRYIIDGDCTSFDSQGEKVGFHRIGNEKELFYALDIKSSILNILTKNSET